MSINMDDCFKLRDAGEIRSDDCSEPKVLRETWYWCALCNTDIPKIELKDHRKKHNPHEELEIHNAFGGFYRVQRGREECYTIENDNDGWWQCKICGVFLRYTARIHHKKCHPERSQSITSKPVLMHYSDKNQRRWPREYRRRRRLIPTRGNIAKMKL